MATKKKLFSYDDVTDKDIMEFFKTLPSRKHSDYIRYSLRLLMQLQATGQPVSSIPVFPTFIPPEPKQNDDNFEEIDNEDLFSIGE